MEQPTALLSQNAFSKKSRRSAGPIHSKLTFLREAVGMRLKNSGEIDHEGDIHEWHNQSSVLSGAFFSADSVGDCSRGASGGDVHQRRGADPPAFLPKLPSAGLYCSDVVADLRRRPAVGQSDQAERCIAEYASLAH